MDLYAYICFSTLFRFVSMHLILYLLITILHSQSQIIIIYLALELKSRALETVTSTTALVHAFHWKEKWSFLELKSWVTSGTNIRHGIPSNWRIFELNWLDIESQFANWILVPPVTQLFMSKWLHFFYQCSIVYTIRWKNSKETFYNSLYKDTEN